MFFGNFVRIIIALFLLTGSSIQSQHASETKITPFIADVEQQFHRVLQDGQSLDKNESGKYYLDSHGRLRCELGRKVTISDPVKNVIWLLDMDTKVARKYDQNKLGIKSATGKGTGQSHTKAPASATISRSNQELGLTKLMDGKNVIRKELGSRVIEGVICDGKEVTSAVPADSKLGNSEPMNIKSENWYSKKLGISVLTISEIPIFGRTVMKLKNIKIGSEPKEDLFRVPEDYRIIE
jgi:hypothetical protein